MKPGLTGMRRFESGRLCYQARSTDGSTVLRLEPNNGVHSRDEIEVLPTSTTVRSLSFKARAIIRW